MKNFTEYITETKEKPLYTEWDVKDYFYYCLDKWYESCKYFNIINISKYSIIDMCRKCEIALMLFDKFSDDIQLHFYSAESEEDKKTYGNYWTSENNVYKTFKIIEQISTLDLEDNCINPSVDIKKEIADLKSRFEDLVKKSNEKWHKAQDKLKDSAASGSLCGYGTPVPCECDCCKCGY